MLQNMIVKYPGINIKRERHIKKTRRSINQSIIYRDHYHKTFKIDKIKTLEATEHVRYINIAGSVKLSLFMCSN